MKKIIWLSLFVLLATDASAQRSGFGHGGFGRGGFGPGPGRGGFARGGFRQGPFRGQFVNRGFEFNRRFSAPPYGFGWFGYPGDFVPYDYGYPPQPIQPNVIVVQQPPTPQASTQAPPEVRAVIHEYAPAAPTVTKPSAGALFGIVMKDGSTRSATALVVNDDVLKYIDPDDRNLQVPLDQVDREATRKLNRERNLSFWLPATP